MKREYTSPELEIIKLTAEDVITTSLIDGGNNGDGDVTPWGGINGVVKDA